MKKYLIALLVCITFFSCQDSKERIIRKKFEQYKKSEIENTKDFKIFEVKIVDTIDLKNCYFSKMAKQLIDSIDIINNQYKETMSVINESIKNQNEIDENINIIINEIKNKEYIIKSSIVYLDLSIDQFKEYQKSLENYTIKYKYEITYQCRRSGFLKRDKEDAYLVKGTNKFLNSKEVFCIDKKSYNEDDCIYSDAWENYTKAYTSIKKIVDMQCDVIKQKESVLQIISAN